LRDLIFRCCSHDPEERPTFTLVQQEVARLLAVYEEAQSRLPPNAPQRYTVATLRKPDRCPADVITWTSEGGLVPLQLVACARRDYTVDVWSLTTRALQCTLVGHLDRVTDIAFCKCTCPKSDCPRFTIATASADASVRLWSADKGEQLSLMLGHDAPAVSVTCLQGPNNTSLVVSVAAGELCVWQPGGDEEAACCKRMEHGLVALSVAAAPTASCMHILASRGEGKSPELYLLALKLDPDCGSVTALRDRFRLALGRAATFELTCHAFSNDGLSLATGFSNNTVVVYGTMGEPPITLDMLALPLSCRFSGHCGLMTATLADGRVQFVDVATQTTVVALTCDGVETLCAAPDSQGRGVAVGFQDGTVRIMDRWGIA